MAGEKQDKPTASSVPKILLNANGRDKWEPNKYQRMAVYIAIYNYIKNNIADFTPGNYPGKPSRYDRDFGLKSDSLLSVEIDKAIRDNIDWFFDFLGISKAIKDGGVNIVTKDGDDDENYESFKKQFLREMDDYIHESSEIVASNKLPRQNNDGSPLTNAEMDQVLRAKEDDVRKYFDGIRNSVEGKPGNIDNESGKPVGGFLTVDMTKADQERKEILNQLAENSGSVLFKTLLSAGGAGLTVASGFGLLSYGGLAIGSMFGPLFAASPVGMAAVSVVGLITGFKVTKKAISGMFSSIGKEAGLVKKYFEFMHGIGDYKPDADGKPKGYLARKNRYEKTKEMKAIMIGFKIPDDASKFEEEFDKYYKDWIAKSKYWTPEELKTARKDIRFNYQVTDDKSAFGRARALISKTNPTERASYGFTSPDELVRIYNGYLTDLRGDPNLVDAKRQLESLTGREKNFSDAGTTAQQQYRDLMAQYASIVMDSVNGTAFNQPLGSNTLTNLNNAIVNPVLNDRIKNYPGGDQTFQVENIRKFIMAEADGTEDALDENVYASVDSQLIVTKEQILKALQDKAIKQDGDDLGKFSTVASFIEQYTTNGQVITINGTNYDRAAIEVLISNIESSNRRAGVYLKYMLDKRELTVVSNADGVRTAIDQRTGNLTLSSADDIYNASANLNDFVKNILDSSMAGYDPAIETTVRNLIGRVLPVNASTLDVDFNDIAEEIKRLPAGFEAVREYLTTYLHKQKTGDPNSYVGIFANEIAGITISDLENETGAAKSKTTRVRELIMGSELSAIEKSNAVDALNRQIESLENARKVKLRAEVLSIIKNNGFHDYKDIMDRIEKINYENIDKPEILQDLYIKDVDKASPKAMRDYLDMHFKKRVKMAFLLEIENKKDTIVSDPNGLEIASKIMQKVASYNYLDQYQKNQILDTLSQFIEQAFTRRLNDMEREILTYVGKDSELTETLRKYTQEGYASGGFKTYFENPTPTSESIVDRIDKIRDNSGILKWIVPNAKYGSGNLSQVVDKDSNDTRFIVAAYFKDPNSSRPDNDGLRLALTNISTIYSNTSSYITADGTDRNDPNGFICRMRDEIADVDGIASQADQLAAFMSMKKHLLEMYRYQLYKFFGESIGTTSVTTKYNEYETKNVGGSPVTKRKIDWLNEVWIELMAEIDAKCVPLLRSAEVTNNRNLSGFTNYSSGVDTILSYNSPDRIIRFMKENQHNQPDLY